MSVFGVATDQCRLNLGIITLKLLYNVNYLFRSINK